jgi:D-3-phosphoglycerate dehydrogenase / 2-oxoglutarate reductase
MRTLIAESAGYSPRALRLLRRLGDVTTAQLDRQGLLSALGPYDVLVVRLGLEIDKEVLQAGRSLRAIVSPTTGLDHIDLGAAAVRGIAVLSLKGDIEFLQRITATGEHTWALLLALVRRIPFAFSTVLRGEWRRDRFRGHTLAGRRLGILGLGRVGEQVAGYGLAFGMHVHACDPFRPCLWPDFVSRHHSLETLLSSSDVLTLHVPLEAATERLIGAAELSLLPRGAVLVNTSRGELLDEIALLEALNAGQLAGAALDVICGERELDPNAAVLAYATAHDNLLITPHLGGATWEAMHATEERMAERLLAHFGVEFCKGNPLWPQQ